MGFFDKMIKNAVSNGIGKGISEGISKGISDALGGAVKGVVEPKATEFANKAVKEIEVATKDIAEKTNEASKAINELNSALDNNVILSWNDNLSQYPVWNCGGYKYSIKVGDGYVLFKAVFDNHEEAVNAIEKYREVLRADGFKVEGPYALPSDLYKNINGEWYNADTSHLFEGDNNVIDIYFIKREPTRD